MLLPRKNVQFEQGLLVQTLLELVLEGRALRQQMLDLLANLL